MPATRLPLPGFLVGALVGAAFGLVFLVVNGLALPAPLSTVVLAAAVGTAICLLVLVVRRARAIAAAGRDAVDPFRGRFPLIVAVEAVAIFGGLIVLDRAFGLGAAGVAWVATVVGLHFVPMARLSGVRAFAIMAAALTPLGVVGLALAFAHAPLWWISLISGVLSGVVLLANAVWALVVGPGSRHGVPGPAPAPVP